MEPMSERISGGGSDRRARRAWGGLTVAVAGFAAAVAFMNGAFVGSAGSAGLESGPAWPEALAAASRQAVTVPGDYPTLQRAIDAVADGTTILVAPGTYAERIELRGRTLHLWGVGCATMTTFAGNGADGPVASVRGGSVQFDGITFQGGRGESGRGASVQDGAARFTACRFVGNAGGALAADARVRFDHCEFAGNRAGLEGGALQSERSAVRLEACSVHDNAAATFGGGVSAPVATYKPEPEYSEEARKAKYQGEVWLSVVVDEKGVPQQIKVTRKLGLGLDEKAIEAVSKWRFKPGMKDGKPVAVQATIAVSFHLL